MQKILVTGSGGQLGQELQALSANYPSYQFYFSNRAELDIANEAQVIKTFDTIKPDYCINCAAYTAVDKAETEPEIAFAINANGVQNLAAAAAKYACCFVHISTDYVFDGRGKVAYKENDTTNPLGVYGASKRKGEELAMTENGESTIIRTSWVYSVYGNNFVKTMVRLMKERPSVSVVADQWGSPTYAADLAAVIMQIVQTKKWLPGIYHFSNEGVINWFQFAEAIKGYRKSSCVVHPITTEQYPTPVTRPKFSVLNTEKIKQTFGIKPRNWQEGLHDCLDKLHKM